MFEKTYTISEFLQMLDEDKNKEKTTAKIIGTTLFLVNNPVIAFAASSDGLWELGTLFLGIAQKLGYFIILTCAIVEIIKMAPTGADKEDILKVLIKYILLFASLFLLPNVFNLIAEKLGGGIAW